MAEKEEATSSGKGICFYGDVDKSEKGKILSAYPVHTLEPGVEKFRNETRSLESDIENNRISFSKVPEAKIELAKRKEREAKIDYSIEEVKKLVEKNKDVIAACSQELTDKTRETMPSFEEMKRRTVSPQNEAKLAKTPCIDISKNKNLISMAEKNGIPIDKNGRITRDGAHKLNTLFHYALDNRYRVDNIRRER